MCRQLVVQRPTVQGDGTSDFWSLDATDALLTYAGQGNAQVSAAADAEQVVAAGDINGVSWGWPDYP
ncbi:hypothetical protein ACWGH3_20475 [Streptomyces sp. NPDC054884]|uniref:hypothetical protein n=1 Tax=Streptomyces sp. ME08-AFT2 TaxID=3028683 RepID=UPI0029B564D6|nr:hypothetical protein [Streptomyces sp. ME08-AFT2]MDX3313425.1 hypothetical protein [Streptomyces sp. ME08-AFT2]